MSPFGTVSLLIFIAVKTLSAREWSCAPPPPPHLQCLLTYLGELSFSCSLTAVSTSWACASHINDDVKIQFHPKEGLFQQPIIPTISHKFTNSSFYQVRFGGATLLPLISFVGCRLIFNVPVVVRSNLHGDKKGPTHLFHFESLAVRSYYKPGGEAMNSTVGQRSFSLTIPDSNWPLMQPSLTRRFECNFTVVQLPSQMPVEFAQKCFGLEESRRALVTGLLPFTHYRLSLTYRQSDSEVWSDLITEEFRTHSDVPSWPSRYSPLFQVQPDVFQVVLPEFPPGHWNGPDCSFVVEVPKILRNQTTLTLNDVGSKFSSPGPYQIRLPIEESLLDREDFEVTLWAKNRLGTSAPLRFRVNRSNQIANDEVPSVPVWMAMAFGLALAIFLVVAVRFICRRRSPIPPVSPVPPPPLPRRNEIQPRIFSPPHTPDATRGGYLGEERVGLIAGRPAYAYDLESLSNASEIIYFQPTGLPPFQS